MQSTPGIAHQTFIRLNQQGGIILTLEIINPRHKRKSNFARIHSTSSCISMLLFPGCFKALSIVSFLPFNWRVRRNVPELCMFSCSFVWGRIIGACRCSTGWQQTEHGFIFPARERFVRRHRRHTCFFSLSFPLLSETSFFYSFTPQVIQCFQLLFFCLHFPLTWCVLATPRAFGSLCFLLRVKVISQPQSRFVSTFSL